VAEEVIREVEKRRLRPQIRANELKAVVALFKESKLLGSGAQGWRKLKSELERHTVTHLEREALRRALLRAIMWIGEELVKTR
jgi:hypothetical protein